MRVFHQLHLGHSALFAAIDRSLKKTEGITTAHQVILFVLAAEDGLTSKEVARRSGHSKTRLTGLVDTLERLGLVRRKPGQTDGRVSTLNLTVQGRAVVQRTSQMTTVLNKRVLEPFDADEQEVISRFLSHIQAISPEFDQSQ